MMATAIKHGIFLFLALAVLFFVSLKIFSMDFPITNFDNLTLGMATAQNIDISKVILWYMIYTVLLCLFFAWLFNGSVFGERVRNFFEKKDIQVNGTDAFFILILVSIIILSEQNFLTLVLALSFLLMMFLSQEKELAIFSWAVTIYSFYLPLSCIGRYFPVIDEKIFFAIVILISSIIFCFVKNFSDAWAKLLPFVIAAIFSFILFNVIEISYFRGHSISNKILVLPYILALLSWKFFPLDKNKDYGKKIAYGGVILIALAFTPHLKEIGYVDFFEYANHGLTIQELIANQGLPLIDNLDAHMLAFSLPGILYFIITGDYLGSLFSIYTPMSLMVFGVPSMFYLMKKFFNVRQSFLILALFPMGGNFYDIVYIFPGFIAVAIFVFWKNNPTFLRSLALQISVSLMCLYRIDLGASFGIALFLTPIIFCIVRKQKKLLAQYILSAILWASLFFTAVYGIGFKFWEDFLTAFNSNQHWAICSLGIIPGVYVIYFIVPIFIAIFFLPLIKRILKHQEEENDWLLILLYFTFILGISRMMVRHTLIEPLISTFTPEIFLLAFLAISFCKRCKETLFVGILFILTLICAQIKYEPLILHMNKIPYTIDFMNNQKWDIPSMLMEEDKSQIESMKKFCDENLKADETYFDFTNQSLFFAFIGKKNPIYINQCPAMINGVKGQKQTLEQLKDSKVKFVFMPYLQRQNVPYLAYEGVDDTLNCDRYYLLLEWIAKNYQPYQPVGNFFVWKEKDNSLPQDLNYNYEPEIYHGRNFRNIPFLWGKTDIQSKDTKIAMTENNLWDLKNVSGKVGFIALEISSEADYDAQIKITGKDISDIFYNFKLNAGTHIYRFRVSSDILWYSDKVEFLHTDNLSVNQVTFQEVE